MQTLFMPSSFSWYSKSQGKKKITPWGRDYREGLTTICIKYQISYCGFAGHWQHGEKKLAARNWKFFAAKADKSTVQLKEESVKGSEKKGTVIGAVALIIGTSIGTGILALPKRTSPAGFIPSAISLVLCWGFLLIEALLLVEINVGLLKKMKIATHTHIKGLGLEHLQESMEASRGQGGIQLLLAAEQEAQHIVNGARNAKMARLKQAKDEAEKEIAEYRAHVEAEFQKKLAESSGDSGANLKRLELETEAKIHHLKTEAARISHDVVHMLLKHVTTVKN
ncbi:hypothetical protein HHK36_000574 [Tetracentron sinense]|uniref:V-type proton ATPase subunit G n=1 Tax=Tetracentron sinense TaxID=13715 RepID=A0A834ZVR2_TETSI|nr:hypothetical protein HHK36_000574 [Tetracentron sinense]